MGDASGEAELFMVDGFRDWGNSLRPPAVPEPTRQVRVAVRKLDDVLAERGIEHVDFIKLDAEGGELAILEGAKEAAANRAATGDSSGSRGHSNATVGVPGARNHATSRDDGITAGLH